MKQYNVTIQSLLISFLNPFRGVMPGYSIYLVKIVFIRGVSDIIVSVISFETFLVIS